MSCVELSELPQRAEEGEGELVLFEHLPGAIPALTSDFELRQKLLQWNLSDRLKLLRFRVKRRTASDRDELKLIDDFFRDDSVRQMLDLPSDKSAEPNAQWKRLRVSVTSMSFFDRLVSAGVVATDGSLRRFFDETFGGCMVSDQLREMLLNPDSQHTDLFSPDGEQEEFIFQLFRTLVIGGSMCQADDSIRPYEDATRTLYRALVSVKKNSADPTAIDVTSHVYTVDAARGDGNSLFRSASPLHSCFVVLDPKKRWLTVWHHPFVPFCHSRSEMVLDEEDAAVGARFLRELLANTTKEGADAADVEYMIERLVPVLVSGVVHLLKAVVDTREREANGEADVEPVNPLNHLAKYLLRHNPRFGEPENDIVQLQARARKMLRK